MRGPGSSIASCLVLLVATSFLAAAVHLGGASVASGRSYSASFSSSEGLAVGAAVDVAGVPVGRVTDIKLDRSTDLSRVTFEVDPSIRVSAGASVRIGGGGDPGADAALQLDPGGSARGLPPGSQIAKAWPAESLEQSIGSYIFGSGLSGAG